MIKHIKSFSKVLTDEGKVFGELLIPFNNIAFIILSEREAIKMPKLGGIVMEFYEYNGEMIVRDNSGKNIKYYVDYHKAREWFLDENGGCFEITLQPIKAM